MVNPRTDVPGRGVELSRADEGKSIRLLQRRNDPLLLFDQRIKLRDFHGVVPLLVLSKAEQIREVLWTPAMEEEFVLGNDRQSQFLKPIGRRSGRLRRIGIGGKGQNDALDLWINLIPQAVRGRPVAEGRRVHAVGGQRLSGEAFLLGRGWVRSITGAPSAWASFRMASR